MANELPYFQFEPAEYLTKDISFCSLESQGLFINICAYYWQRECKLTKQQFLRRLNKPDLFDELVEEGVIDLQNDNIIIKFLDLQYEKATNKSKTNSINGSKGGRPKKKNRKETELKPKQNRNNNQNESETKGIREDKIKEDNINTIALAKAKDVIDFNFEVYLKTINELFDKNHRVINQNVKAKIKARLKDGYTKNNFWIAMQNVKNDAWHKENNYKYCTPSFFAQQDKLDKYGDKLRGEDNNHKEYHLID